MNERIIAVNSNCYHGYTIEEALEGIAAAGFKYVELTATKGWTEHVFPNHSFEYLCSIKNKLNELGLKAFSMSGHCNLMDDERLPDFILNIKLAAFFNCDYIVSSIGEAHLADNKVANNDVLVNNLNKLIPILEENKLTLVLELHGEHSTGTIMNEIVEMVNSPLVKINYDTANCLFYGGVKAEQDIDVCMENIAYLHLKDKRGEIKEWDFPALGKGYVDFETIFKKLEAAGNNSPFSVEIEFTQNGPKDLQEINEAVKASAEYLQSHSYTL